MFDELMDKLDEQEKRIKELETINEEHRKINGELRNTINEAIDYNEKVLKENWYGGYEKENATKTINILQGKSDE